MKKMIILYILYIGLIPANANDYIDRSGWHFGMGVSLFPVIGCGDMIEEGQVVVLPTLDMLLDYGISPQLSIGFESKNWLVIGNNTLHLKYYTVEAENSTYFTGGISLPYAFYDDLDEDNETISVGVKAGVGYAWNHRELEVSIHHHESTYFDLSWRYKF